MESMYASISPYVTAFLKNNYYHARCAQQRDFYCNQNSKTLLLETPEQIKAFCELESSLSPYDIVILTPSIMQLDDLQQVLQKVQQVCTPQTRLIVHWHSYSWSIFTWTRFFTKRIFPRHWFSKQDMLNMLHLAGYEPIIMQQHTLVPCYIPLVSWLCNTVLIHVPFVWRLGFEHIGVAKPIQKTCEEKTVSIIIPARNERGNIEDALKRLPKFGVSQEIIFVEGHSRDNTLQEMYRVQKEYPEKNIKITVQKGKGKGDAVRAGFALAEGDVLMILDGDITMPPEQLPKFYYALIEGKGEFINGTRLLYGMESQAMNYTRMIANYGFSVGFTWLLGQRITDTLCGTKVLYKQHYQEIERNRSYFGNFDPFGDFDLLFGAAKLSLKITEVPIKYKNRTYGTTQINPWICGILLARMFLFGIFRFKIR